MKHLCVLLVTLGFSNLGPAQDAVPPAAAGQKYVLQPGDSIELRAFNMQELDQTVVVRPDGRISLLLLGDVQASGRTPDELSESITGLYSLHFREPKIAVIVQSYANLHVFIGGEVGAPGLVPLTAGMTALGAIFRAGGFKETSKTSEVLLMRGATQIHIDLEQVLQSGQPDVPLEQGDILFIPKSVINVYVGGEVARPGLVSLNGRMTALQAIVQAGGLRPSARTRNIVLLRDSGKAQPSLLAINIDQAQRGESDTILRPYDVVYVPQKTITKINQFVDQYVRQLIPISLNGGFTYLLGKGVTF
jgi:polysaccharide export outer membrane protein